LIRFWGNYKFFIKKMRKLETFFTHKRLSNKESNDNIVIGFFMDLGLG